MTKPLLGNGRVAGASKGNRQNVQPRPNGTRRQLNGAECPHTLGDTFGCIFCRPRPLKIDQRPTSGNSRAAHVARHRLQRPATPSHSWAEDFPFDQPNYRVDTHSHPSPTPVRLRSARRLSGYQRESLACAARHTNASNYRYLKFPRHRRPGTRLAPASIQPKEHTCQPLVLSVISQIHTGTVNMESI